MPFSHVLYMNSGNTKLLALDFDGVICDSAVECMLTSYNSLNRIRGVNGKRIYDREDIDAAHAEKFLAYRPLVRVAREYYLLWCRILDEDELASVSLLEPANETESSCMQDFNDIFYSERKIWIEEDYQSWLRSNPLYSGMQEFLTDPGRVDFIVISAKDRHSIKKILESNGCSTGGIRIYGSETGLDKPDLMRRAHVENNVLLSDIVLIDDNLENLLMLHELGVEIILAGWGYSLNREKETAGEMGIQILALDGLPEWVNRFAEKSTDRD